MKLKKKASLKYETGGKLDKLKKAVTKNRDEKPLTKKGDKQVMDADLGSARSADRGASVREAKANVAAANANVEALLKEYRALSPEDRKGERGKTLKAKLATERDSKRGNSKYNTDLATDKQGRVRVIGKKLKV